MASWLFDDGKGDDVVGFVGEAQVGVQPTLAHMLGQGRGKLEQGLAQGVVPHAHRVERGRRGDAGAECLAEGLLGREALGQQPGSRPWPCCCVTWTISSASTTPMATAQETWCCRIFTAARWG